MAHRYFTDDINGKTAYITGGDAAHLSRVLRIKCGDEVILCDKKGTDYTARVCAAEPERIEFEIISKQRNVSEPSVSVTLYVGYPKQDKLEFIIQKAVELGAERIVPFFSRFCVAAPKKEEAKNIRYNKIAYEAAKQCGRGIIPKVEMPVSFDEMLQMQSGFDVSLFCYEAQKNNEIPLHSRLQNAKSISVITGAEGGFSPQEAEKAEKVSCLIGLGPRILRCETAPIAALSAIMVLTGNLQ